MNIEIFFIFKIELVFIFLIFLFEFHIISTFSTVKSTLHMYVTFCVNYTNTRILATTSRCNYLLTFVST